MDPEDFQDIVDNLKRFCEENQGGCCQYCPEEELCDLLRGRGLLVFGNNIEENLKPLAQMTSHSKILEI